MSLSADNFDTFHFAIHGYSPFDWQTRLLHEIMKEGKWPDVLDLPTGAGKTTCIDIALFALALDAEQRDNRWCPRRIAMVVDRRVVVDQVAERGRKLLRALISEDAPPIVKEVARQLSSLCKEAEPVGVFTLRGGMPKDDGWARTPDQPLILASTVDQFGSRLLIQGYGVSTGMKPVHAGLLGNDVLLFLDEVHLSNPFAETLHQLEQLRGRQEQGRGFSSRFCHVFLSATPPQSNKTKIEKKVFGLRDEERRPGSPLGPRLHAQKPCVLREETGRDGVEKACADEARKLIEQHDVIAVVVNRVASAMKIVDLLHRFVSNRADVELLTGRMRPLDRDDKLKKLWPRIMTGRDRAKIEKKLIVVGTQCIEAGADFDFDALVTEAASFDALRQRFGRVDRLGSYKNARGVIVQDKSDKDDPVYRTSIAKTIAWLKERLTKKTKEIDFGILALPKPSHEELEAIVAPREPAPVLLPAYMDLWMQTSPMPASAPDVSLWLHGRKTSPADVQVVWRVDLSEDDLIQAPGEKDRDAAKDRCSAIVAAIRPSSLEAISLPFMAVRRWLSGERSIEDITDVELASDEENEPPTEKPSSRWNGALRWDGDRSEVIKEKKELRPGDTIVVPATRGGIREGCFDPESSEVVKDLAERAALFGRGQPMLRLHPRVLKQLDLPELADDLEEARAALKLLAEQEPVIWRQRWLKKVSGGKAIVVDAAEPWTVLQGTRVPIQELRTWLQSDDYGDSNNTIENGVELTTDEDDSFHAGRPVPLSKHSQDVEHYAREYATRVGLSGALVEDIARAGWLHDIGKADRRFQIMLRGGSEIDFLKDTTPWAKSAMPPGAKSAHRLAQKRSGYPWGARHEIQSLAMIEGHCDVLKEAVDIDLVKHLVASHHGYCRPFAPAVKDGAQIGVELFHHRSMAFGNVDFGATSVQHGLHRLDSPLADRFWRLVEKYGWLELCWLEAILRLADHRASEAEQEGGGAQ